MRHPTTDGQHDFNAVLGAKIATMRKRMGATQAQLGEVIGLGRASMGNIEQGIQALTAYNLWALANYLGVTIDELLPGTPVTAPTTDVAATGLRQTARLTNLLNRAKLLRAHLDDAITELENTGDTP